MRSSLVESQNVSPPTKLSSRMESNNDNFKHGDKRYNQIQKLKVSTGEKERLQKRREIIKSMRFLRQTGKTLREQLAKNIKAYGKFQR